MAACVVTRLYSCAHDDHASASASVGVGVGVGAGVHVGHVMSPPLFTDSHPTSPFSLNPTRTAT